MRQNWHHVICRTGWVTRIMRAATLTAAALSLVGCASLDLSPNALRSDLVESQNWVNVASTTPGQSVTQRRLRNGLVSVMCTEYVCQTLLITDTPCPVGALVPVLLSAKGQAGITDGDCLRDPDGEAHPERGIFLVGEFNLLLEQLELSDSVSIAVPMQSGEIAVFHIPLEGLRKALEQAQPRLFDPEQLPDDVDITPTNARRNDRIIGKSQYPSPDWLRTGDTAT